MNLEKIDKVIDTVSDDIINNLTSSSPEKIKALAELIVARASVIERENFFKSGCTNPNRK